MALDLPLETPRLILQKKSGQDFNRFFLMSKDPEVWKYIGDGSIFHWSREAAIEKFDAPSFSMNAPDAFLVSVYRKDLSQYIGWCCVKFSKFLGGMDFDYRFLKDAWGNGFATETGCRLIREIFRKTDIREILACVHPENHRSLRVLEKLGFSYVRDVFSRPIEKSIRVYSLSRSMVEDGKN